MDDTCARCGKKLYFVSKEDTKPYWYRNFIFDTPHRNFWFDENIEKILNESTKYRKHKLCMSCSVDLDKLIEEFLKGDSDD